MSGEAAQERQRQVLAHPHPHHQRMRAAVFGDQHQAAGRGAARSRSAGRRLQRPALHIDPAMAEPAQPDRELEQFAAARAREPVDAEDLAGVQRERRVAHAPVGARDLLELEQRGAAHRPRVLMRLCGLASPRHRLDQAGVRLPGGREGADPQPVAQHADAVGDAQHLAEPVRDVQHRLAVAAQAFDDREQPLGVVARQRRGRLVEDQQFGLAQHAARQRQQGALRRRQLGDQAGQRQFEAERGATGFGRFAHAAPRDQRPAARERHADEEVVERRQRRDQLRLLVDHRDAPPRRLLRRREADRLAVPAQAAVVGRVDAGQHIDQRRLAGAVLADQRMDFAAADRQVQAAQRRDAREALADPHDIELHRRIMPARSGRSPAHRRGAPACRRTTANAGARSIRPSRTSSGAGRACA